MTLITKNQNDNLNEEFNDVYEIKYVFSNTPLNRLQTKPGVEEKTDRLNALKVRIQGIKDCELRKNAKNFVFNDGDINSSVMIVGEGPGQKEDDEGKPFVGDAGLLLNKMLNAIKIDRSKIYITNVVNFRPPNNRKPQPGEILRYSNFLREHIEIIIQKYLFLWVVPQWRLCMVQILKFRKKRKMERSYSKSKNIFNNFNFSSSLPFKTT